MTTAYTQDTIPRQDTTSKSPNDDPSPFKTPNALEQPTKRHQDPPVNGDTIDGLQTCSRQLEMYLESRGIQTWDEDYADIGKLASASTTSLDSHEVTSEGSSSGYNSCCIDSIAVKNKRDSDSLSASSQSDFGELNCIAVQNTQSNSLDSSSLKNSLHELERSMAEILRNNLQSTELSSRKAQRKCEDINYDANVEFYEAVRRGNVEQIRELVESGAIRDLNEPDWNVSGDPPLLVAASNHCLPVLCVLLSHGCDPGVRSPRGETALHRAILNGGPGNVLKFVRELLKYGCSPSVKEAGGGLTALHILARQLAHASRSLQHFDEALETLALLAQAGTVNDKDHQGHSALHILASSAVFDNNQRTEVKTLIQTLLDAGADPTLKNDRGETPLHESLECGALVTADLLMPHTPPGIVSRYGETPLHIAARKNYTDVVAQLLKNGEDPSLQDAGGNTALHLASARGFHQIVSLLVTSPLVQMEKANDENLTALQVAAESGFINAVTLLLTAGADPTLMTHSLHQRHPDISTLIDHALTKRRQCAT